MRAALPSAVILLAAQLAAQPRSSEKGAAPERANREPVGGLEREVAALRNELAVHGHVRQLAPRLLERGDRWPIVLDAEALDPSSPGCTSVFVVGTRNVGFSLQFGITAPQRGDWPVPSAAGFALTSQCGARKSTLQELQVVMRSSRGLIEVLVLQSQNPPPPAAELFPARWPGTSIDAPPIGPRPLAAPLAQRLKIVEEQESKRGARNVTKRALRLDRRGQASVLLTLGEGCHRLHLVADAAVGSEADLDAQLLRAADGEEVARDDGDSPQAVLRQCTGRPGSYRATVVGGVPDGLVTLVHAEWDMALGLPVQWGPLARGEMAQALWRDLPPRHAKPPISAFAGVQGRTQAWLQTRPGGCYLVGVGAMRGAATRLLLEVEGDRVLGENRAVNGQSGTSVSFCARGEARMRIQVVSAGAGLTWLGAVWEFPEEPNDAFQSEAAL